MNSNELKIGNLVLVDNKKYHPKVTKSKDPLKVVGLSMNPSGYSVQLNTIDVSTQIVSPFMCQLLKYIKPIPLTEEWLIKFGFEKVTKKMLNFEYHFWQYSDIMQVFLIKEQSEFEVQLKTGTEWFNFYRQYKYLHQLQNLYFALTNEELTHE